MIYVTCSEMSWINGLLVVYIFGFDFIIWC